MPDTGVWTPWKEEHLVMDHEVSKRFDKLDDQNGKIFDLLRESSDRLNAHLIQDAQEKATLKADINGVGTRLNEQINTQVRGQDKRWAVWLALIGTAIMAVWEFVKFVGEKAVGSK